MGWYYNCIFCQLEWIAVLDFLFKIKKEPELKIYIIIMASSTILFVLIFHMSRHGDFVMNFKGQSGNCKIKIDFSILFV